MYMAKEIPSSTSKPDRENAQPRGTASATDGPAENTHEITELSGRLPSSDVLANPPLPNIGKSPSYIQKRRAKAWNSNRSVTVAAIADGEPVERKESQSNKQEPSQANVERRRVTRSKSIVNIMKVHTSTSSIPVDGAPEATAAELQRSGSDQSLAPNKEGDGVLGHSADGKPVHANGLAVPRKLTKPFTSDSVIFQETSAQENDGIVESEFLAADHPLMKRYQEAVKEHLTQQKEQLQSDLKQSEDTMKRKQRDYEKAGQDVYVLRQELDKLGRALAQKDHEFATANGDRLSYEEQLTPLLEQLTAAKTRIDELAAAEKMANDELRRLNTQINESLSDVAITNHMTIAKNAIKKAQQDLIAVEQEKTKQDSVTTRLLDAANRKEAELKAIEAEIKTTAADVADKRDRLLVLNAETQSISMEKRNLLQRWNATLKGMRKRDEEFAEVQTALQNHQQNASRVENELSGLAKVYANVRESNDRLIGTLVRLQDDLDRCTNLLGETQARGNNIEGDVAVCQQALEELTLQKNSMHKEKAALASSLNALVMKLRSERNEIAKLEDSTSEFNSDFQTNDKSMADALKQLDKVRRSNREMEKVCSDLEAELEKETLLWMEVDSSLQALKKSCEEYKELTDQTRVNFDRVQQDFERQASVANKKQFQIDGLLKKLDIEKKSSNVDALLAGKLNSLRYESGATQKNMNACDERVARLQKEWMKLQDQLIRASEMIENENAAINAILTTQTELEQMKIRLQGEIAVNEDEEIQTKRKIEQLHLQIAKLNDLITKKLGAKATLESDHLTTSGHFAGLLKDAELECVQMEEKLLKKSKEKQDQENALQEAERQLRFWEQKTSEAKSVRESVSGGHDDEEFNRTLADVHRMQVRLGQLAKQQESTVKEMEKAVSKRNILLQKGEAVTAAKTVQLTQVQLNRAVIDLRRKVKQFQRDLEAAEREENECRVASEASIAAVEAKRDSESEAVQKRGQLMDEVSQLSATHFKNLHLLAAQQLRHKRLEDAREGRYEPMCKDASILGAKRRAEMEKRELMLQLVNNISSTYPNLADSAKKIEALLRA